MSVPREACEVLLAIKPTMIEEFEDEHLCAVQVMHLISSNLFFHKCYKIAASAASQAAIHYASIN